MRSAMLATDQARMCVTACVFARKIYVDGHQLKRKIKTSNMTA